VRSFSLGLAGLVLLARVSAADAAVEIPDHSHYWPGWNNGTADDSKDSIGTPDFFNHVAGTVEFSPTGLIQSVTFHYNSTGAANNELLYGDLFLSVGQGWDYVVRTNVFGGGDQTGSMGAASLSIYDYSGSPIAFDDSAAYQLSSESRRRGGGSWSGYGIREDHPWALASPDAARLMTDTVAFSGWQDAAANGSSTFDFTGLAGGGLDVSGFSHLTIGFAVQCANDVVFETINTPGSSHVVPEPDAFVLWLLLGASGVAMGWLSLRRA